MILFTLIVFTALGFTVFLGCSVLLLYCIICKIRNWPANFAKNTDLRDQIL